MRNSSRVKKAGDGKDREEKGKGEAVFDDFNSYLKTPNNTREKDIDGSVVERSLYGKNGVA